MAEGCLLLVLGRLKIPEQPKRENLGAAEAEKFRRQYLGAA